MIDWQKIRAYFPAVNNSTYLCTAGGGCLSTYAKAEVDRFYNEMHLQGDICWDAWLERVEKIRSQLAHFINAEPTEIAFLPNTSLGFNFAAGFFNPKNKVLALKNEFPSVTLPWLHLGFSVKFLPTQPDGSISQKDIEKAIGSKTKILIISFVQYVTGFRHNLAELGEFCKTNGLFLIVDATQGFGVFPIDVKRDKIDILIFSGYKWVGAGYAIAPMYIRHEILSTTKLPAVGWRSSKMPYALRNDQLDFRREASALELGHPPFPGIFALGGALQLLDEIGIANIEVRVHELMDYLLVKLAARGIEVLSTKDKPHRSGIVMIEMSEPERVAQELAKRNIYVSARGNGIRVAVHFYNNEKDIEKFVAELVKIFEK